MRIGFAIYGGLDTVSGGFVYDRALVGALAGIGHQIDVIGLPFHAYARSLVGSCLPWRSRARFVEAALGASYDAIIEDELIHPSLSLRRGGPPAGPSPRPLRITLVHNLRSEQPSESFPALKRAVERRYLAGVDGAIAVCKQTHAGLRALAGDALPAIVAYPGRDHVAPGVEGDFVDRRAAAPGPLRVLHVASVLPHKGLHRLLDAMARASSDGPEITLDVVGRRASTTYARQIERQIVALGLASRVRLHGERRGAELAAIFRRSQVMALPSDREAYSLACLEALGFGLPVLATASGGLGEMLADGREGYLLDPNHPRAWAEALTRLAGDRAALGAMGRAALARYRAHATWHQVALTVQDFLAARLRSARRDTDGSHKEERRPGGIGAA
jgi:glycosyltransferase involved in cell wall biosynthesis